MSELQRIVTFDKPFDKRHTDPAKNYGIGAMQCWMVLKGDRGAVQFMFSTGIYLPNVWKELNDRGSLFPADGWDVGYHSKSPMYEGQSPMGTECQHTDGEPCYYDGSGLRGDEWFSEFLEKGDEHIWQKLEQEYRDVFGDSQ